MKFKYSLLTVLSLVALACGEQELKSEDNDALGSTKIVTADVVTKVEKTVEETNNEYTYFEDYINLTTKKELIDKFGIENLEDGVTWFAEGTVKMEHTVLVNPLDSTIIKFLWNEDGERLSAIEAFYYKWNEDGEITGRQKLKTSNGLWLGMSLEELKSWNGADFKFSGFGWDYAGGIFSEKGSEFEKSNVKVRLMDSQEGNDDSFNFIIGDVELSTSESRLAGAPIFVQEFTYYIEEE